jgi:hypothetical protein
LDKDEEVDKIEEVDKDKCKDKEEAVNTPEEAVNTPEEAVNTPEDACKYRYQIGSYVAAVYQGEWFVGQVLDKTKEPKALPAEDYIYVNFMQRVSKDKDLFKWPDRADKLNTLREDILFECGAPVPSKDTSTTRSITYSLTTHELKRANNLMNKDYYHIKFIFLGYRYRTFCKVAFFNGNGCQFNGYIFGCGFLVL